MSYKLSDAALLEAPLAISFPAAKANGAFFLIPLVSAETRMRSLLAEKQEATRRSSF